MHTNTFRLQFAIKVGWHFGKVAT